MIRHIVMWKFVDNGEGMTKAEIMQKISKELKALVGKIDVINGLEVGASVTSGDMIYDMGLIVTVDNLNDLKTYATHPEHVKVSDFVAKVRTSRVTVDLEF